MVGPNLDGAIAKMNKPPDHAKTALFWRRNAACKVPVSPPRHGASEIPTDGIGKSIMTTTVQLNTNEEARTIRVVAATAFAALAIGVLALSTSGGSTAAETPAELDSVTTNSSYIGTAGFDAEEWARTSGVSFMRR